LRVAFWLAFALLIAVDFSRRGYPLWEVFLAGVLSLSLFYIGHFFWYWEILPDRLVHQRYFLKVVFPFPEITYAGPVTGPAAQHAAARKWILIQNATGRRMIANPANPEAFLSQMRERLPGITPHLSAPDSN